MTCPHCSNGSICSHCEGSGFCTHSTMKYNQDKAILWNECDHCGKSNIGKYWWVNYPTPTQKDIYKANLKDIICKSCNGKGF